MILTVNGETRESADSVSISQFLEFHSIHARMVVVERNGEIVPREDYGSVILQDGDALEIVQMMAGG